MYHLSSFGLWVKKLGEEGGAFRRERKKEEVIMQFLQKDRVKLAATILLPPAQGRKEKRSDTGGSKSYRLREGGGKRLFIQEKTRSSRVYGGVEIPFGE